MKKKSRHRTDFSENEYDYFRTGEPEEDFLEKKRGEPFDFAPRRDSSELEGAVDTFRPRVIARFPNLGPVSEGTDGRFFRGTRRFSLPIRSILLWTSGVVVGALITTVIFLNGPAGVFFPKKTPLADVSERSDFVVETSPSADRDDLQQVVTAPNQPVADAKFPVWDENSLESIPAWPGSAPSNSTASTAERSSERPAVVAMYEEEKAPTFGDLLDARQDDSRLNDSRPIDPRSADSPQAASVERGNPYEQFGASEPLGKQAETAALPSDIPTWNQLSTAQPPVFNPSGDAEKSQEIEAARPMKNDLVRFTPTAAGDVFAPNGAAAEASVFAPSNVSYPESLPPKTEIAATDEFYHRASGNVAAAPSGSVPANEGSALSRTYSAPSAGSNFTGYRVTSENSTSNFTPISGNAVGAGF